MARSGASISAETMADQHDAVRSILHRLLMEGRKWYRHATTEDVDLFERRVSGNFSIFEGDEIHTIGLKPAGSFPPKKILLIKPSAREKEAVLGMWLLWNFRKDPSVFRLFLGQWSEVGGERTFIAFRFEAPEQGKEHDYFHCQTCQNFGDKELVPNAVRVSQRFPTIPLNASNIVELTICALMAALGRKKTKHFVGNFFKDPATADNEFLRTAYARCCKESFVDFR